MLRQRSSLKRSGWYCSARGAVHPVRTAPSIHTDTARHRIGITSLIAATEGQNRQYRVTSLTWCTLREARTSTCVKARSVVLEYSDRDKRIFPESVTLPRETNDLRSVNGGDGCGELKIRIGAAPLFRTSGNVVRLVPADATAA